MKALILVDIQNDFLPGGALAVPEGDQVIPVANALSAHFDLVVATQDHHPAHHGSFAANHPDRELYEVVDLNGLEQVLWPVHCVQGTPGGDFAADLNLESVHQFVPKGTDSGIDSYSGFFDNGQKKSTGLDDYLRSKDVDELYIMGLAADFCVKFTALDAAALGYRTHVIVDGTRGVNLTPDATEKAFEEMEGAGIKLVRSEALLARVGQA